MINAGTLTRGAPSNQAIRADDNLRSLQAHDLFASPTEGSLVSQAGHNDPEDLYTSGQLSSMLGYCTQHAYSVVIICVNNTNAARRRVRAANPDLFIEWSSRAEITLANHQLHSIITLRCYVLDRPQWFRLGSWIVSYDHTNTYTMAFTFQGLLNELSACMFHRTAT